MQRLAEDPTTSPGHLGDTTSGEAATRWPRPRRQGSFPELTKHCDWAMETQLPCLYPRCFPPTNLGLPLVRQD